MFTGVIPRISFSWDDLSERINNNEPVFNDISSLLKHKMTKVGQHYLDSALNIKMSAEKKLTYLKMKTKNTIKRKLKSLQSMFGFTSKSDDSDVEESMEPDKANISVELINNNDG